MNKRNRENEDDIQPTEMIRKPFKKFTVNKGGIMKYDDKTPKPNIMAMNKEERLYFLANDDNPFGYPQEYWDIYKREKERRNLQGFENLANITNLKVFTNTLNQIPGKMIIKNHSNINCFKSNQNFDETSLETIRFNEEYLSKLGMFYGISFEFFVQSMKKKDQRFKLYFKDLLKKRRNYLQEFNSNLYYETESDAFDYFVENFWKQDYIETYKQSNCDIYDCILAGLNVALGEYSQFVCVAGGFALSMYIYKNYGYHIGFNDADLFIHSCNNEIKDIIVNKLSLFFPYSLYNENVISLSPDCDNGADHGNYFIYYDTKKQNMLKFQIIRRLYSCPQEVIAGFDVDSCCILTTLDRQIYVTERGEYSIRNGYNTLNFERMSPSYEYRLLKYNTRGFAIWIPFMEHFKENAVFAMLKLNKKKGSTIFLKYFGKSFHNDVMIKRSSTDYVTTKMREYEEGMILDFKTLNPNEQTINTFHRIFLEDPFEWYPVKPTEHYTDFYNLNFFDNINLVEINSIIPFDIIYAKNLVTNLHEQSVTYTSTYTSEFAFKILKFIYELDPNISVFGDIINGVIFGSKFYRLNIERSNIISNDKMIFLVKLFYSVNVYFSKLHRISGYHVNIDTVQSLNSFKFLFVNENNIPENININDFFISKQYMINVYTESNFIRHINMMKDLRYTLNIILPDNLEEVHYKLVSYKKYVNYCDMYRSQRTERRKETKDIIKENKDPNEYVKEKELLKLGFRNFFNSFNYAYSLTNPLLSFEQWSLLPHNNNPENDTFKIDIFINPNIIPKATAKKNKINNFQFTNGKIYGTVYNTFRVKYHIKNFLDYPVIENFVV
jgi:hypothetical protein